MQSSGADRLRTIFDSKDSGQVLFTRIETLRHRHACGRRRATLYTNMRQSGASRWCCSRRPGPPVACQVRRFHDAGEISPRAVRHAAADARPPHAFGRKPPGTWSPIRSAAQDTADRSLRSLAVPGLDAGLAYAQTIERVTELVLRWILMLRRWDWSGLYQEGPLAPFPDAWQHYSARSRLNDTIYISVQSPPHPRR